MKTAIVTGASTGIGRATAMKMAEAGYHLFLIARTKDKLEETATQISEMGGESTILVTDLSKIDEVNKLIKSILSKTDSVDAIINIAGIWHGNNEVYADTEFQEFDQKIILDTYSVGFISPTLLVHGLLAKMRQGGKIVNLSGTFENGAKGWLPYYASKRALEDLTIGLAEELADKGIQVNAVSPSDTATDAYAKYFPQYINEANSVEKIVQQILELCSQDNMDTGKVFVIKKGESPFEGFHS